MRERRHGKWILEQETNVNIRQPFLLCNFHARFLQDHVASALKHGLDDVNGFRGRVAIG